MDGLRTGVPDAWSASLALQISCKAEVSDFGSTRGFDMMEVSREKGHERAGNQARNN